VRLNLVVLRSMDVTRASAFYRALGLPMTRHEHGGAAHYAAEVGGCVLEIYPPKEGGAPTSAARLGFEVASVDELLPAVLVLGAELVKAPHDSPFGRRAVVRDLDGHSVDLVSPALPSAD
jgi:lactoylglutathione lyase